MPGKSFTDLLMADFFTISTIMTMLCLGLRAQWNSHVGPLKQQSYRPLPDLEQHLAVEIYAYGMSMQQLSLAVQVPCTGKWQSTY